MFNQLIRDFGKKMPFGGAVDTAFRYSTYQTHYKPLVKSNNICEEDMLVIGTIARSGTHYMMILLANYLAKLGDINSSIGPSEMNEIFPNNWHLHYMSYHKLPLGPFNLLEPKNPNANIKKIGLTEVTRSHSLFQKIYWRKSPVLHLYRNPLDYAVSLYNYKHKKRPDLPDRCASPNEVLELKFQNYVAMYKSYQSAAKDGKYTVLRISYENLITQPAFYLTAVLQWLGYEPIKEVIESTVIASSINKIKIAEQAGAKVNPDAIDLKGSFISSGQIGQWKNHFDSKLLSKWTDAFYKEGIDLNTFILE